MKTMNVEPDWVGMWKYFIYMQKTNPDSFQNVFSGGEDDKEWIKIKRLGEAGCHSVQEYMDKQQRGEVK